MAIKTPDGRFTLKRIKKSGYWEAYEFGESGEVVNWETSHNTYTKEAKAMPTIFPKDVMELLWNNTD